MSAIFIGVLAVAAGFAFPEHKAPDVSDATKAKNKRQALAVWAEKRSLILAVLGFSFIMAEMTAGTWMPIALTKGGYSGAEAASAFGVFWIVITIARLIGGFVVDLIGRYRTVLFSAITTVAGILLFMTSEMTGLQYLGICVWGLGISLGFPLVVSSMGDDVAMASPRVNMIITVVYISSITVGPALGALGQATSIYVAFGIPLVMMIITAILSGATKPLVKS
jgi:fucose permease